MPDPVVPTAITPPAAPAAPPAPAAPATPLPLPGVEEELAAVRLELAATRAGLGQEHLDVAAALLPGWLKVQKVAPTAENLARFVESLRKSKPTLFGAGASTAPIMAGGAPAAPPAGGSVTTKSAEWAALRSAGRMAEAQVHYEKNRAAILRGQ